MHSLVAPYPKTTMHLHWILFLYGDPWPPSLERKTFIGTTLFSFFLLFMLVEDFFLYVSGGVGQSDFIFVMYENTYSCMWYVYTSDRQNNAV